VEGRHRMKTTNDEKLIQECLDFQVMLIDLIENNNINRTVAINSMMALSLSSIWQAVDTPEELRKGVIYLLEGFIDKKCKEEDV